MSTDPTHVIGRLWVRMAALYGSRWEIEYGPAGKDGRLAPIARIWADVLADVPPDRIAAAIRVCMEDRASEHPPTLPEFLRLCRARAKGAPPAKPPVTLPKEYYATTPSTRCAQLADHLRDQAQPALAERLERAASPRQRDSIAKAYWMSQIGGIDGRLAATLARQWSEAA